MSSKLVKHSKFLSYVLRHQPQSIGLTLDGNGWVDVAELLRACQASGEDISPALLTEIVESNNKQRFTFDDSKQKIRANQGHSVTDIDLNLAPKEPPLILFHGTVNQSIEAIRSNGLQKMNRQHVHLSQTKETAIQVGSRRGKPIILIVNAETMHNDGYRFYCSENGVWLTDSVPWSYIERE